MHKTDEELTALSEDQLNAIYPHDRELWWRGWQLKFQPGFAEGERRKALATANEQREFEIKQAEKNRELEKRERALTAPPPAPPVQKVSHEAISKEFLEQICEKRGVKQRQFTDEELKCLKVKRDATKKEIALLRSRIWDDYLFRAKTSETLRKPVPHFLLLATREMFDIEVFALRNELETKAGTDKVGELMLKIAEMQRHIDELEKSRKFLEPVLS
jgi:hypothetical protein